MSEAYARGSDPSTSHEAAEEVSGSRLETEAYDSLKTHGGWVTNFQWSQISGIKYASITPRGKRLWEAGRVEREKRPGLNDLGVVRNLLHYRAK